jgi:hypothetical protein
VIARNSSFAYKGKAIDIRQIGRELVVRYVLEGSARRAGSRLRITGQLVEAETGAHLWAERIDSVLDDVFDLQDRVTMAVAGAIEPSVTQAEIRRANNKPTGNLQAYDWLLRALGERQLFSREGFDRAIEMAWHAIELDPRYAQAYAYLASFACFRRINGWMQDEAAETAEGVQGQRQKGTLPAHPVSVPKREQGGGQGHPRGPASGRYLNGQSRKSVCIRRQMPTSPSGSNSRKRIITTPKAA